METTLAEKRWAKPSEEERAKVIEKTKQVIEQVVCTKAEALRKSTPSTAAALQKHKPKYLRYIPTKTGYGKDSGTPRVIRMVDVPVDPLEPPKSGFQKTPAIPNSAPTPVLHSPPRKLTKEERDSWIIPPCISNWKNAKGYTIPLDKRLAADGRGLQEHVINDKFASLSEALMISERLSREEVRQRAAMQQKIAQKEKALKEENLRQLAAQAREERQSLINRTVVNSANIKRKKHSKHEWSEDSQDEDQVQRREEMRREKSRQLTREYRMSKYSRPLADRDVTEKIALGVVRQPNTKEITYDSRLFNQSEGLGSGFAQDDAFNVYDKPLFPEPGSIYRGIRNNKDDRVIERSAPVEFERKE